jgi:Putative binding domain, N-terminal/Secretion system C-terminal sorting domain/Viral BACON domain
MMKQLFFPVFASFFLFISLTSGAQAPVMTSWESVLANDTRLRFRMHDRSINNGFALCEVSFDMAADRCALTDNIIISIYEDDGSGGYGTERFSTSFHPGAGPISSSEMTRIQVISSGITEKLYARAKIIGFSNENDFDLETGDCSTMIVTGDAYDPNEHYLNPSAIPGGTTHEGLVVNADGDYYELIVTPAERRVIMSMSYLNDYRTDIANLDLDLFLGSGGSTLASSTSSATSTSSPISESIDVILDPGSYFMCVRPKGTESNRNFYSFSWEAVAAPDPEIGGLVRDNFTNDVLGVAMTGLPGTPITDIQGRYSTTVPSGWNGTVTPELEGYTFDPSSRTYTDLTSDLTFENYVAYEIKYLLSGTIEISPGTALSGVIMSGVPGLLVTDVDGKYSRYVSHGWSGTITPTLEGYSFTPSSTTYTNVTADQVVNYTATWNTYTIAGTVSLSGGGALSGISMSGLPGDPVTDSNGDYSASVDHGWSGTVTPNLEGYTFDPVSRSYADVDADHSGEDYTATINTYTISGTVETAGGSALSGVSMYGLPGDPVTDNNGYYSADVEFGVNITVTPVLNGYTFDPVSTAYHPVEDDETTDYTGTRDPYLLVSQKIMSLGQEAGSNNVVEVTSNVDWTVICPEVWISFSQESGSGDATVTVTALSENVSTASRSATVTVTDGVISRNFSVSQAGSGPFLETSVLELSLASTGGATGTVDIVSNLDWVVSESSDWLTVTPESGAGDGVLTISALSENRLIESRTAMVTVTGGEITHSIEVTQSGGEARLEVSTLTAALTSEVGSYIDVDISSNIDWNASKDMAWLSVSPQFGSGDGVLTLLVEIANPENTARTALVSVTGDTMIRIITVTQAVAEPEPTGSGDLPEYSRLKIYPNPASEKIFMESNLRMEGEVLVKLMDITGKVLHERQLPVILAGEPVELDLSGYPVGQYLLLIHSNSIQKVYKILKNN